MTTWEWIAGASLLLLGFLVGYMVGLLTGESRANKLVMPLIRKLDYKPGDYVMIHYPDWLNKAQRSALANKIAATFPPESSITAVVLEGGITLQTFATAPEGKDRRRPVGQGNPVDWSDQ